MVDIYGCHYEAVLIKLIFMIFALIVRVWEKPETSYAEDFISGFTRKRDRYSRKILSKAPG